jgi:hypothetical protein
VPAPQFELGQLTSGDRLAADEHVLHGENLPSATDTPAKRTLASRSTSRELANVRLAEIQELDHRAAACQRPAKRELVGELQVAPHRQPGRDARHGEPGYIAQHPH